MKKSFAVIGLGRFGSSVAEELFEMGQEVLAVDMNMANVENIKDKVTVAVQADMRDERALSQLEIQRFDVVLITIGSDAHKTTDLASGFREATAFLEAVGFHEVAFYRKRQPTFIKIKEFLK